MPEWLIGAVSKTVVLLVGTGGSNPPLSAAKPLRFLPLSHTPYCHFVTFPFFLSTPYCHYATFPPWGERMHGFRACRLLLRKRHALTPSADALSRRSRSEECFFPFFHTALLSTYPFFVIHLLPVLYNLLSTDFRSIIIHIRLIYSCLRYLSLFISIH